MWSELIDATPRAMLENYFNVDDPLGPTDASLVTEPKVLSLLTEQQLSSLHTTVRRPSIVVGRRGSGKTSYLRKLGLSTTPNLFIEIRTERVFVLILGSIDGLVHQAMSVESVAAVWDGVFWNCLFWLLNRTGRPRTGRATLHEHLRSLNIQDCHSLDSMLTELSYVMEKTTRQSGGYAIDRVTQQLRGQHFELLKSSAIRDLKNHEETVLLVLDSLDDYPLRVEDFRKTLAGLLKCAGAFNAVVQNFDLRLCLPAELYRDFADRVSTNSAKDFLKLVVVRWQVSELLIAACRRMMIYLRLAMPDVYRMLQTNPLDNRARADEFMAALFPSHVDNANGLNERMDLYILRHTQLLPRQLFMLLNAIFARRLATGPDPESKTFFSTECVRNGIADKEGVLVDEIFSAFAVRYPDAQEICAGVLPSLPKVFTTKELHDAVSEFAKLVSKSLSGNNVRTLLLEIGAIGKVDRTDSTYVWGKFAYTQTSVVPIGTRDKLCVHPLFSKRFDSMPGASGDRPILPLSGGL